ncbi:MAG: hypothetical protein IJ826_07975 [Bacteroidaceae bacterium]|nr:hypothetical protein [Bacteroidaceae bacterium]
MTAVALKRETENYWALIKDAGNEVKLALIKKLSDAVMPAVAEKKSRSKKAVVDNLSSASATLDDEMLDAALSKFHKDWGGSGTAKEIADELRSSRVDTRTVETW